VIFRSPWRRLIVMTLALVVPVLANGVRAWGIVVLAEYLGSAEAAAADHIIYGWGFFSAIILLLVLAGLPFREDGTPPALPRHAVPPGRGRPRPAALAAALVPAVALTAAGPAVAATLAYQSSGAEESIARLAPAEGCLPTAGGLDCQGFEISARMLVFSPRANWREVSAARWRLGGSDDTELTFTVPIGPEGGVWRARQPNEGGSASAIATWLDGRPVGDGLRTRLTQARNSLAGGGGRPVLVLVEARLREGAAPLTPARERVLLQAVLSAQAAELAAEAAGRSRAP
jgi:exosortase/archaeosortase family protein